MNAIINGPSGQTMSSREIAELVGSRHDKVKQSIARLAERGVIVQPPLGDEPETDTMGRTRMTKVYTFSGERGKRDSIVVVAQLCPEFTARLVDRWQELERCAIAQPAQLSRMDLIQLALAAEHEAQAEREQRLALEAKVEADAPMVAFAESVVAAPDAISLGEAAKIFGTGRNRLSSKLKQIKWLTRFGEPYQDKINQGLPDVKIGQWTHPEKGLQRSVTALVTGKGLAKLKAILQPSGPTQQE